MKQEKSINKLSFDPIPLLTHPFLQTVIGSFGLPLQAPLSKNLTTMCDDGAQICSKVSVPQRWQKGDPIVIMIHGLAGSVESRYMIRISRRLFQQGVLVVRTNHRGIHCGRGKSRRLGHGGLTADILHLIHQIKDRYPDSPITLVGFSIGGNMILKLLGELGNSAVSLLKKAVVVSPPVDLYDSTLRFLQPELYLIQKSFTKALVKLVRQVEEDFPDETPTDFPKKLSILEFDELYTAPKWGYNSVVDYYEKNSSAQFVPSISIPCRILYSSDDLLVSGENIDRLDCPPAVSRYRTEHGGHLGYLGQTERSFNFRWMDQVLVNWLISDESF